MIVILNSIYQKMKQIVPFFRIVLISTFILVFQFLNFAQGPVRCEVNLNLLNRNGQSVQSIEQSLNLNVCSKDSVYFKNLPDSLTDARYQWFKNGTIVKDSTKNTFIATSSGEYYLQISYPVCVVTSPKVVLNYNSNLGLAEILSTNAKKSDSEVVFCGRFNSAFLYLNQSKIYASNPEISVYNNQNFVAKTNTLGYYAKEEGEYNMVLKSKTCISNSNSIKVSKGTEAQYYNGILISDSFVKKAGFIDTLNSLGCVNFIEAGKWTYESNLIWYENNKVISTFDKWIPVLNNTKYYAVSSDKIGGCNTKDSVFVKIVRNYNKIKVTYLRSNEGKNLLNAILPPIDITTAKVKWFKNNLIVKDTVGVYRPLEITTETADYKFVIDAGSCGIYESPVYKFNLRQVKIDLYNPDKKTQKVFNECPNAKLILEHTSQGDWPAALFRNGSLYSTNSGFDKSRAYEFSRQFTITESGSYFVQFLNTGTATYISDTITVNIASPISPKIELLRTSNSQKLVGPVLTNYQYQWLKDGQKITGAIQNEFVPNTTGEYALVLKMGSCFLTTNSIFVETKFIYTTNNKSANCVGETVNLTAAEGSNYQWNGPNGFKSTQKNVTLSNLQLNQNGLYKLEFLSGGITIKDSVLVQVKKSYKFKIEYPPSVCEGQKMTILIPQNDNTEDVKFELNYNGLTLVNTLNNQKKGAFFQLNSVTNLNNQITIKQTGDNLCDQNYLLDFAVFGNTLCKNLEISTTEASLCPSSTDNQLIFQKKGTFEPTDLFYLYILQDNGTKTILDSTQNDMFSLKNLKASDYKNHFLVKSKRLSVYSNTVKIESLFLSSITNTISAKYQSACEGTPINLVATTTANQSLENIKWFKNGAEINGANSSSYKAMETGKYTFEAKLKGCDIKSIYQDAKSNTVDGLALNFGKIDAPTFDLKEKTICKNNDFQLVGQVNSYENVQYQWLKNGTNFKTSLNNSLIINEAGEFQLKISQGNCTATSSPFVLKIDQATATISGGGAATNLDSLQIKVEFTALPPWIFTINNFPEVSTSKNPYLFKVINNSDVTYELKSVRNGCGAGIVSGKAVVNIILAQENINKLSINYGPNPTNGFVKIMSTSVHLSKAQIGLYDARGKKLNYVPVEYTNSVFEKIINISTLPAGNYTLKVSLEGKQNVYKIIKN